MKLKYLFSALFLCLVINTGCDSDDDINSGDGENPGESIAQGKSFKRGVSYNFQLDEDIDLLFPGITWFYNWGASIRTTVDKALSEESVDYYPMIWNGNYNPDNIRSYKAAHPDCEYILAFNEPNLTDQANMIPSVAAALWPEVKALANELGMKIVSPAMNYGTLQNYSDPIKWLDEFFELVPLSDIDGIAIHCYMGTPTAFVSYINLFKKYGKPIWMTEFCGWEEGNISNVAAQMAYMCDIINYMECDPDVYRYAWFIPRWNTATNAFPYMQLLTKTEPYELTDLGQVFMNLSTLDQSIYYNTGQVIPAAHYSSLNMAEAAKKSTYQKSVRTRVSTDSKSEQPVEIHGFLEGHWVEYQINAPQTKSYNLLLRYASYLGAQPSISVDGKEMAQLKLEKTGEDNIWETAQTELELESGKHTIRFTMASGSMSFNWWSFN